MAKAVSKTKRTEGNGPIARTNRFFIQMKAYGHCDDKGRTVMGVGMSGKKIIAKPDRPLMTLVFPLVDMLTQAIDWSDPEAAKKDLADFQAAIAKFEIT